MLTESPTNEANVATIDIPVAMLIPLEQAFNHISRFNIFLYFLYFFLNIFSLFINSRLLIKELRSDGTQPEVLQVELRGHLEPGCLDPMMEDLDMYYSSSFLLNE